MKKKLFMSCVGVIFMLLIGFVAAASVQKENFEKKSSPLFKIRIHNEVKQKSADIKINLKNILTTFVKNRIFLSIPLIVNSKTIQNDFGKTRRPTTPDCTCVPKNLCLQYQNSQTDIEELNTRGGVCTYNKWCWDS